MKAPELANREKVTKEENLEILSKGENNIERENAENESRSGKLGDAVENALLQQPTSIEQNSQVTSLEQNSQVIN